jgi:lipopolysaccharide export LptBFGC system permease protein LptF
LKRGIKYIVVYLLICLASGYIVSSIDYLIVNVYSVDVKEEINDILDKQNKVLVNGTTLTLFLRNQSNSYYFNSFDLDQVDEDSFNKYIENKNFYISKFNDLYTENYYIDVEDDNKKTDSLISTNKMNKVRRFNNIFFNVTAILIGIFFVFKYNRILF